MLSTLLVAFGVLVVVAVIIILLFKTIWKVAEPNEALVISGLGANGEADANGQRGFKIVVGRGTAVIPGFQTVRRFDLSLRTTGLTVNAVSKQSIPLTVKGIVAFKVADDRASIGNAARRFLGQSEDTMRGTIHELFSGHLRAIVGGLSVEDMLHEREELMKQIRASVAEDMARLGLTVETLQIQEIDDEVGYIDNLGKPQAADVEAKARIAAAERDREATEAEQVAAAEKAAAVRDTQIKEAGFKAEIDRAEAESAQSGPLMEAQARQEVVRQETLAAELDAARQEKVLDAHVKKPADAKAYEQVTLAEAERQATVLRAEAAAREVELSGAAEARSTEVRGLADAKAVEARGLAEAAGIKARATALAENQDAVIAQTIAENYPEIVRAGASAMGNIDNMVVLNGADGVEDILGKTLTMGGAGFGLAQNLIASLTGSDKKDTTPVVDSDSP